MKTKEKILILFCCISYTLQAQTYTPLISEDHLWSYCNVIMRDRNDFETIYREYYFRNDTTINQTSYKKLYKNDCGQNAVYYVASMREENKKTYAVFQGESKERLIYDFSLNKGDDFHSELTNNLTCKVQEVDSINVNGMKRKRIIFEYSFDIWIEGIGSLDNHYLPYPLSAILTYEVGIRFNYQKDKGDIVYNTSEWYFNSDECKKTGLNVPVPQHFNIYPTYVKDKVKIKLCQLNENLIKITVIDCLGRSVQYETMQPDDELYMNLSNLHQGVYFLRLESGNNVETYKVFKVI